MNSTHPSSEKPPLEGVVIDQDGNILADTPSSADTGTSNEFLDSKVKIKAFKIGGLASLPLIIIFGFGIPVIILFLLFVLALVLILKTFVGPLLRLLGISKFSTKTKSSFMFILSVISIRGVVALNLPTLGRLLL